MYCGKCGTEITGADKFCPKCGMAVSTVEPTGTVETPISKKNKKKDTEVKEYILKNKEIEQLSDAFVSKDEKFIASLGNGYIMNYLATKNMNKGFAFITDKRVYFKGSCLSGTGKKLVKTNEERTVDVKSITGSGFIYKRYLGILASILTLFIIACISATLHYIKQIKERNDYCYRMYLDYFVMRSGGITWKEVTYNPDSNSIDIVYYEDYIPSLTYDGEPIPASFPQNHTIKLPQKYKFQSNDEFQNSLKVNYELRDLIQTESKQLLKVSVPGGGPIKIFSIIILDVGLLVGFVIIIKNYLFKRKTLFRIEYAGGCIAFDVSFYAKAEIDDFQKQLRRAKDLAEEYATKVAATEASVQPSTQNSVSDDLRKYAELLKEGLISQEEYDSMKKKILNL